MEQCESYLVTPSIDSNMNRLGVEADDDIEGDAVVLPAQTHDTKPKAKHHKASKNNGVDSEPVTAPQEIPTTVPPTGLPHSVFSTSESHSSYGIRFFNEILIAQDESMKNLMMSWYYAGYYTGLAEGQQKARTETEAQPNH